jgi:uncharacterized membrane protein YeaQ/YmgE (transglycosylase-associated protein family)
MVVPVVLGLVALLFVLWVASSVSGFLFGLLPAAAIGLLTGWVATKVTGTRLGLGWTLLAGLIGSWIGGSILSFLGIGTGGLLGLVLSLAASVVGAAILITLARVLARPALTGSERRRLGGGY